MTPDRTTQTETAAGTRRASARGRMDDARPAEFVEALAKGLAVLESFDNAHPDMSLSEIARRTGSSPAAARRSLITLQALGYIGRQDKRFHLRPRILTLGSAFYFSARIDEMLQPFLRDLVTKFGDASSVATLDKRDVIYVAHNSVQRARRAAASVGARYPAHATSLGRVLLAAQSDADLDRYFDGLVIDPLTTLTITDPDVLRAEILRVRADGYSTTVDQLDYGITALAVPIRTLDGRTIAALNTSGYTGMVDPALLIECRLADLQATSNSITQSLAKYPVLETIIGS